jgi:7,8-dihydropterin-6-yl-methyl-4-(beta-D-ribofuranosyl)aminobenzene 5'-phosphate synthase
MQPSVSVRLTILVDNLAKSGLVVEHGFSAWVETGAQRILFDTGQGTALAHNARDLDVDLGSAGYLVLSHGHYDHTGGLVGVVQRAPDVKIHAHPGVLKARYAIREAGVKPIGLADAARLTLECERCGRVNWTTAATEISPGVSLSGPIPRATEYESTGGPFFLDVEGMRPDPIEDEIALWIVTPKGLVVIMGCGHAGVINTLRHAMATSGVSRVHAVVGGFHLLEASPQRIERTLQALNEISPDLIVPVHCTGEGAIESLSQALSNRVQPGQAGMVLELGGTIANGR